MLPRFALVNWSCLSLSLCLYLFLSTVAQLYRVCKGTKLPRPSIAIDINTSSVYAQLYRVCRVGRRGCSYFSIWFSLFLFIGLRSFPLHLSTLYWFTHLYRVCSGEWQKCCLDFVRFARDLRDSAAAAAAVAAVKSFSDLSWQRVCIQSALPQVATTTCHLQPPIDTWGVACLEKNKQWVEARRSRRGSSALQLPQLNLTAAAAAAVAARLRGNL